MAYTVKQIGSTDITPTLLEFIAIHATRLNEMYGNKFNWMTGFPLRHIIEKHVFLVCYKDEMPVGFMIATIQPMVFDINKTVLRQELLFGEHPKATYELLRYFIDLGKLKANHVITCIGAKTNIKPESLRRLGFTKLEELYRLEV